MGIGITLLVSASMPQTEKETPRYHLTFAGTLAIVYNSTTGEYKDVGIKEVRQSNSLKELLEKREEEK